MYNQSAILPIHIIKKDSNDNVLGKRVIHFQINAHNDYDINYKFFLPKGYHLAPGIAPNVNCHLINNNLNVKSITFIYIQNSSSASPRPVHHLTPRNQIHSQAQQPIAKPIQVRYIDSATRNQIKSGMVYGHYGQNINVINRVTIPAGYTFQGNQRTVFRIGQHTQTVDLMLGRQHPVMERVHHQVHTQQVSHNQRAVHNKMHPAHSMDANGVHQFHTDLDQYNHDLKNHLIQKIINHSENFFQKMLATLFAKLGYRDTAGIAADAAEHEVSGIVRKDRQASSLISAAYVRARKYRSNEQITINEIRDFVTCVMDHNSSEGIFITTSSFQPAALQEARRHSIITIDGEKLAQLLIHNRVGVQLRHVYKIFNLDQSFFR